MTTPVTTYTIGRTVAFDDVDAAIDAVTAALAEEGFGVLTTIDVKATLKQKIDIDVEPYVILGACNPSLAHRGMDAEPDLGALLPCNVIVRHTDDGSIRVAAMEPLTALGMIDNPQLEPVAREAHDRLVRALDTLPLAE